MRSLAAVAAGFALALGFVAAQSWLVQLVHDSCRLWHEPPPWAFACPPSTRHGAPR